MKRFENGDNVTFFNKVIFSFFDCAFSGSAFYKQASIVWLFLDRLLLGFLVFFNETETSFNQRQDNFTCSVVFHTVQLRNIFVGQ